MFRVVSIVACLLLVGFASGSLHAEVITIEGTIKSVDAKKRTITVKTKTKTHELDVSRKAKISVKGKSAGLSSLKPGQKVKLSYHDKLEIVLKIDASRGVGNDNGEIRLFNGKDLKGWKFDRPDTQPPQPSRVTDCWAVDRQRGVLKCLGNRSNWLETEKSYENFTLKLEWRFPPGRKITSSGSGVVIRSGSKAPYSYAPRGIEIQIASGTSGDLWANGTSLETDRRSSDRLELFERKMTAEKRIGEWNSLEIICDKDRITVILNDKTVNEGWGMKLRAGKIALLSQRRPVEFRNIRLIELKSTESKKRGAK